MSFFSASHVTAGYGNGHVVDDVSFELDKGCLMGILGANGSGKTTLLKAMCGILPHEGSCQLEGARLEDLSVRHRAKVCSYIPQRSGIAIDIPVLDVVLMGLNPHLGLLEHPSRAMENAALKILAQVGLEERAQENYLNLSEGQKQLCILARTLLAGSRMLFLDEPESALDFRHRYRMLAMLRRWAEQVQGGVLVTLHDPVLALNYCDRLLLLSGGQAMGIVQPRIDPMEEMEQLLGRIYGPVSLQHVTNRKGECQLIMLNEENV